MSEQITKALEKMRCGYNCAQAVVCAYSELFGMEEKEAFRLSEGFGGGMGGLQGVCGAVTGAFILAGLKNSKGVPTPTTKPSTYRDVRKIAQAFEEKNSTTICALLKGEKGGVKLRSCEGCVEDACNLVEKILLSSEKT
jgi:C_GCAxxG_C_C family probable redox protein